MLVVLVVLLYLYISPARALWTAWHDSRARRADVAGLERGNAALRAQRNALLAPGALQLQARRLGLVRRGERLYEIGNLPSN